MSMPALLHELIFEQAALQPTAPALCYGDVRWNYAELADEVIRTAMYMHEAGIQRYQRVAIFLEKRPEAVAVMFAASRVGAVFVPINPLLKPEQLAYVLRDCNVSLLAISSERLEAAATALSVCTDLRDILLVGEKVDFPKEKFQIRTWSQRPAGELSFSWPVSLDIDMAAILYTSGSTGHPKGVVLSHRNVLLGASSVASYLENTARDRILCALPLSFDYGLNQLTTAFLVGACAILLNYLLPRDILKTIEDEAVTGFAAVPALWSQLARQDWAQCQSLRYLTNSGGAMPRATLDALRESLPTTKIFLMYGLTEAFRSTFLPPEELTHRPDSIGKAIPNAEVFVLRSDGSLCDVGEPGELVHRGDLVAMGYWNDTEKTAERFRPWKALMGLTLPETVVWSGDIVRRDDEGFLYFVGRNDDMIKVSGYRISPLEVEEIAYSYPGVSEAVAFGVAHPVWGQAVVLVVATSGELIQPDALRRYCQQYLPTYMVPAYIVTLPTSLPRNPNGKIDRKSLQLQFARLFEVN